MLDAVAIKEERPKSNFMMCFYTLQIFTIHSPELYGKSNRIWGKLKRNLLKRHIKKLLVCAKTISNQQRILKILISLDVNNLQSWNYVAKIQNRPEMSSFNVVTKTEWPLSILIKGEGIFSVFLAFSHTMIHDCSLQLSFTLILIMAAFEKS